jgi:hypothetical protein
MLRLRVGVAVLAVALFGSGWLLGGDDKPKYRGILPPYYKKLGLGSDQVQQIYKIQTGFREKADELKRQLAKLKADEKAAVEKVLTPGQLKRLRELRSGEGPKDKPKEKDKDTEKPVDKAADKDK